MAYHDELLQQAKELVHKDLKNPTQADLRRSVSSAYYALFHLLIFEACLNWSNHISRPGLARMFEHGVMKKVSKKVTDVGKMPYAGEDPTIVDKLRSFAGLFVQLWSFYISERECFGGASGSSAITRRNTSVGSLYY